MLNSLKFELCPFFSYYPSVPNLPFSTLLWKPYLNKNMQLYSPLPAGSLIDLTNRGHWGVRKARRGRKAFPLFACSHLSTLLQQLPSLLSTKQAVLAVIFWHFQNQLHYTYSNQTSSASSLGLNFTSRSLSNFQCSNNSPLLPLFFQPQIVSSSHHYYLSPQSHCLLFAFDSLRNHSAKVSD